MYTPPSFAADLVALTQSPPLRHRPLVVVGASLGTLRGFAMPRVGRGDASRTEKPSRAAPWRVRALAPSTGGLTLLAGASNIQNLEAAVLVDITPKMERSGAPSRLHGLLVPAAGTASASEPYPWVHASNDPRRICDSAGSGRLDSGLHGQPPG